MAVGPGEGLRYADRTMRIARRWCDELLVYGDRPDADTWDAVRQHATHCRFGSGDTWHESRVRRQLIRLCDQVLDDGDLVLVLDADEELRTLEGRNPSGIVRQLAESDTEGPWPVKFWHLWQADGLAHRADGLWQPSLGYRVYRHQKGLELPDRELGCPPIPNMPWIITHQPVLGVAHWGYARIDDVLRKHAFYMDRDGGRFHNSQHLQSIIEDPTLEPVPWA